jgi:hypothetical protein
MDTDCTPGVCPAVVHLMAVFGLPASMAEHFYNNSEEGTPVIVEE